MTDSGAKVITVGISPCWDITCRARGLDWGDHATIDSQEKCAAGKSLNVSRGLSWMGIESTAAGLWGMEDYEVMLSDLLRLKGKIDVSMTRAPGRTRENVTVIDTQNQREMHLRAPSSLANEQTLTALHDDLDLLVHAGSICVFSGSMPPDDILIEQIIEIVRLCTAREAYVVVDTSGDALSRIVQAGGIELVKPNLPELSQLCGKEIAEDADLDAIIESARTLLDRTNSVLVSMGERGAVLVDKNQAITARAEIPAAQAGAFNTVGCGDSLLAGFLGAKSKGQGDLECLHVAVTSATARFLGWTGHKDYETCEKEIKVTCREIC